MFKSKLVVLLSMAAVALAACSPVRAAEGDLREIKLGAGATQYQLLVKFPDPGTKCLRFMDGADGTTVGKALGCFKMGPQFVVDANGFLTVPVTAGPQGVQGVTGDTGAKGDTGSQGPTGSAGPAGAQGVKGDPGAPGGKGDTGSAGPAGKDGTQLLRIRATTASDGTYTWTFPTPFTAGTLPVISVSSEGSATVNYQHTITALSATAVTVRVTPVTDVTLLGIHILGLQSAQAATIHLLAAPAP